MGHAGAEIGPAHSFEHGILDLLALAPGQIPSGRLHETLDIELGLLLDALIQESADLCVLLKSLVDLLRRGIAHDFLNHQRIELGVLRLFEPVMLEQALELRVEILVIFNALDVVSQGDPFDVQNRYADAQRAVRQHVTRNLLGRADEVARAAEALVELLRKTLEQVNVLGFLAGKLKKGAHAVVVAGKVRTGMIDDVRKDELLDQTEHAEILVSADLIQNQLLLWREKRKLIYLRQRLRHEWFREIELLFAADQIFHLPADLFGCV